MPQTLRATLLAGLLMSAALAAQAQIKVGIDLSTTGPAASIGIPSKNTVLMWPKTLAGQPAEYIILDDASDPSAALRNVKKLTSEERVDVIVGPNLTASAVAALGVLAESQTPMVALAASSVIVEPVEGARKWAFKMPQNDTHMATVLTQHMVSHGVRRVGFIGYADSYGDSWWKQFSNLAQVRKIEVVANERYARTDTSVTGQVLKLLAAKPDAILIAGSGTPAVLPQKVLLQRGYRGTIYQTHGIATDEFLRIGGKDVEGTLFPTGPSVVARELPSDHPSKKVALDFVTAYQAKYKVEQVTQFAGDAWGAYLLLDDAARRALKSGAQPGTLGYRQALRDAIEKTHELVIPNGVMSMNAQDHVGFDQRSRVMGTIRQGRFSYAGDQ
jgi:branched-chain amino acid transport system substrate-binding protein